MAMYGMDLSHYQDKIDLSKGQYDFCIIKATEGIGYTDKSFDKFAVQLTELDKLVGCYHYARPDLHSTVDKMKSEALWFIKEVNRMNLLGKAILVLDWEVEPMDNESMVATWCDTVFNETGVTPVIYGSSSKINKWSTMGWQVIKDYPIWIAKWSSIMKFEVGTNPELTYPGGTWYIWQYSSTGNYPYFWGNVDLDLTEMSPDKWKKLAAVNRPEKEEVITSAMQWCIDKGIFVGDGNGHYMPQEPLTREQAAQVIYNIFNNKKNLNSVYGKKVSYSCEAMGMDD